MQLTAITCRRLAQGGYLTKTLRIMQLGALFMLVFSLTVSAGTLSQTIIFSGKDVPLQKIFAVIGEQTGYKVVYDKSGAKTAKPVSVEANNLEIGDFLELVLKDLPFSFTIESNSIFIKKKSLNPPRPVLDETPPITVRGRIMNENGEPVAASVVVKRINKGTTTDAYGNFELKNVDPNATLIISGVEIETFEVAIQGLTEFSLVAKIKINEEDEVVYNGGYYTTTDRKRTGNIAKVGAKDIERQPVTSPLLALQGRVTGVDVVAVNGIPGSAPKIQIRGQNSLRPESNYPLYVIDGVPMDSKPLTSGNSIIANSGGFDPLSTINPANIQSIEILKDADATAIYGSRGANGVVLITTKTAGKTGATNVQFDIYGGFGKIIKKAKLLNREHYLAMRNEAYANSGTQPPPSAHDLNGNWDTTGDIDWQDALLGGTAQITNAQTSISWSTTNTSFRLNGGLANQTSLYSRDFGFRSITGNFSMNHQSTNKKFNIFFVTNYGANKNRLFNDANFVSNALKLPPIAPKLYDDNGELNWQPDPNGYPTWENPLSMLLRNGEQKQSTLNVAGNFSYLILPGIALKLNMGYMDTRGDEYYVNPIKSVAPVFQQYTLGSSVFTNTSRQTWNIEPQMTITKSYKKHHFNAIFGGAFQQSTSIYQEVSASGYASDALLGSLRGAKTTVYNADNNLLYKYVSALARIEYDYDGKYLLTISGRRDGSSRFGPGKQFGNFGSVAAGWVFSEENFIKSHFNFLSFGKLRGSYGVTGSDQIPDYAYFNTYSTTATFYNGAVGLEPTSLFNPNFAWEETRKAEAELQLGFFADRLIAGFTWYRNRTSNQLIQYGLPITTGFQELPAFNFPALVQNSGWEYQLKFDIMRNKNITWITSFNLSMPKNKLVAFENIESSSYAAIYKVGEPLTIKRLYTYNGVDSVTGLYTVKDVNNDGIISDPDKQFKNVINKNYFGGINNAIRFKNVELSFLFRFVKQTVRVSRQNNNAGYNTNNQYSDYPPNRWTTSKHQATLQKYSGGFDALIAGSYFSQSDGVYSDASFWRLQNLSLAYYIPSFIQQKLKLSDAKVFFQGQNLLTFTSFNTGFDPETGVGLPPLKTFTFGVSLKF